MVYVYIKKSKINNYVGKELSVEEIKQILMDMGMDIKGQSDDTDPELKVEITSEKLDMVSAVGIARAIKFYGNFENKIPQYDIESSGYQLIVKKTAKQSRPRTVCAILKDVPMTDDFLEEMIDIQEKIHDSFGRGRKKGAIGIYPLDKIKFPITFSAQKPEDIIFQPLEHHEKINANQILEIHPTGRKYAHLLKQCDLYPVFRDADDKILSMPPIINSQDLGKVEKKHKDLFIECSGFNISHLDNILKVLMTTFIDLGAKAQSVEVIYEDTNETYNLDLTLKEDEIDLGFVCKWIGIQIDINKAQELLTKMMYKVLNIEGNIIKIGIPPFRSDIWHEVDIADDIARAYGYNNITPKFPKVSSIGGILDFSTFKENFSQSLVSLGFLETYTYMLTSTITQFKKFNKSEKDEEYIRLNNTQEQGLNMIRTMILPESLTTLHINRKNSYPQKIFENGFTIKVDETKDTLSRDDSHLCVCIADPKSNYTQIKGILDTLLKLNEINFKVKDSQENFLIEGRRGNIFVKGENVGFIGEIHPSILENFGLIIPVSALEINLSKLYKLT
ncbi:MAG: phenylalanine--tRNA ligase subunit beta [Nanoarchaeota archaeon]